MHGGWGCILVDRPLTCCSKVVFPSSCCPPFPYPHRRVPGHPQDPHLSPGLSASLEAQVYREWLIVKTCDWGSPPVWHVSEVMNSSTWRCQRGARGRKGEGAPSPPKHAPGHLIFHLGQRSDGSAPIPRLWSGPPSTIRGCTRVPPLSEGAQGSLPSQRVRAGL